MGNPQGSTDSFPHGCDAGIAGADARDGRRQWPSIAKRRRLPAKLRPMRERAYIQTFGMGFVGGLNGRFVDVPADGPGRGHILSRSRSSSE